MASAQALGRTRGRRGRGRSGGRQLMVCVSPSQVHSWQSTLTVWPAVGEGHSAHGHGWRGRNPPARGLQGSPEVRVRLSSRLGLEAGGVPRCGPEGSWKTGRAGPRAARGGPGSLLGTQPHSCPSCESPGLGEKPQPPGPHTHLHRLPAGSQCWRKRDAEITAVYLAPSPSQPDPVQPGDPRSRWKALGSG